MPLHLYKALVLLFSLMAFEGIHAQETIRYSGNEDDGGLEVDSTARPPEYRNGGEDGFFRHLEWSLGANQWSNLFNTFGEKATFEFKINSDGHPIAFKLLKTTHFDIGIPLQKAVLQTEWNPRIKNGKAVETKMVYSIMIIPIMEAPYIEVRKERLEGKFDPGNKELKLFIVVGSILLMAVLLLL